MNEHFSWMRTPSKASGSGTIIEGNPLVLDKVNGYPECITSHPRCWNILLDLCLTIGQRAPS